MIATLLATLRLFIAPLAAVICTLWAALLALAAEADGPPAPSQARSLIAGVSGSRALHVAHLALLMLAGTAAAGATAWWLWSPFAALVRVVAAVGLVWIVADLLPRLLACIAPELPVGARRFALGTLRPFTPLFRLVAWADEHTGSVAGAEARRQVGAAQRDMLLGVFSLNDMTVSEVMTPRIDIVAVDTSATWDEVVRTLRNSEHARLLVYNGHPDAVEGVVHAKDMLAALTRPADERNWHALVRPAGFVPEGKTLDRQLRDFQRGQGHLAIVVDEFGGTAGLVTLEDILEQVVGEIHDERDTDEVAPVQELGDSAFRVQGGVPLSELEELLGLQFGREDVSTVGGFVLAELGRVPRNGETLTRDGVELTVEQVVRRRVRRVVARRLVSATANGRDEEGG